MKTISAHTLHHVAGGCHPHFRHRPVGPGPAPGPAPYPFMPFLFGGYPWGPVDNSRNVNVNVNINIINSFNKQVPEEIGFK